MDWRKGFSTMYYASFVDVNTWKSVERFEITGGSIKAMGTVLAGIVPHMGIYEFMEKLRNEEYDPDHIYEVWQKMEADPETKQLIKNNITCGVCAEGYINKPF